MNFTDLPPPVAGGIIYLTGSFICWLFIGLAFDLFEKPKRTRKRRRHPENTNG